MISEPYVPTALPAKRICQHDGDDDECAGRLACTWETLCVRVSRDRDDETGTAAIARAPDVRKSARGTGGINVTGGVDSSVIFASSRSVGRCRVFGSTMFMTIFALTDAHSMMTVTLGVVIKSEKNPGKSLDAFQNFRRRFL